RRTPSVATYERELRRAQKNEAIESWERVNHDLDLLRRAHRERFPNASMPADQGAKKIDAEKIESYASAAAVLGISVFRRKARAEAVEDSKLAAAEEIKRLEEEAEAEHRAQRAELQAEWDLLASNDPETVMVAVEEAFADNDVSAAPIDCDGAAATILMRIGPPTDLVPECYVTLTPGGRKTVKKRTKTDFNAAYAQVLASNALATINELFAVAPGISEGRLLVIQDSPSNGARRVAPLYCGRFFREELAGANSGPSRDPLEILEAADGLISFKGRTREVVPLDLRDEPELSSVVVEIASSIGWLPPVNIAHDVMPPLGQGISVSATASPAAALEEVAASAPAPVIPAPGEIGVAKLVSDYQGHQYEIRPLEVLDSLTPLHEAVTLTRGKRLLGVRMEIRNLSSERLDDTPEWDLVLVDGLGKKHESAHIASVEPPLGGLHLEPGDRRVGVVCWELRNKERPDRIQHKYAESTWLLGGGQFNPHGRGSVDSDHVADELLPLMTEDGCALEVGVASVSKYDPQAYCEYPLEEVEGNHFVVELKVGAIGPPPLVVELFDRAYLIDDLNQQYEPVFAELPGQRFDSLRLNAGSFGSGQVGFLLPLERKPVSFQLTLDGVKVGQWRVPPGG
ncbi:MAG: hypothetical protein WCJ63_07850, partial [Actinomycetes bacterium]